MSDAELVFCEVELEFLYRCNLDESRSHSGTTALNQFSIPSRASRPVLVCVGLCTVGVYILLHTYVCTYIQAYVQGVQLKAKPNRSSSATGEVARRGRTSESRRH